MSLLLYHRFTVQGDNISDLETYPASYAALWAASRRSDS